MYPIRKAELGDRISSGNASFGYVGSLSGRRPSDPFGGFLNYKTQQSESEDAIDDTEPTVSGLAGVEKLFGKAYGSTEAPNATLRRRSDIIRDKMARRKYRAIKRGEEYNPEDDKTMAARRAERVGARYDANVDKTSDRAMRQAETVEALKEKPQNMLSAYERSLDMKDAKEQMRKEQGRYGFPYTSDFELTDEQSRMVSGENAPKTAQELGLSSLTRPKTAKELGLKSIKKFGGRVYSRGGGIRPIR